MCSKRCVHFFAIASCVAFTTSCSELDYLDSLLPTVVEVDIFNDSSMAAHIMAPEETASAANLVQPGGGRIASVRFDAGGDVTFRATNEGMFILATWRFGSKSTVSGEVVLTDDHNLICKGELFADD